MNKIIGLLLILTQRMHRYEMMLNDLDMSEEADRHQRDVLQDKIEKVTMQHEEACKIKEVNDKRGEVVSKILEKLLGGRRICGLSVLHRHETQLALMHAEIRDKVKMGEEKGLNTLHSTKIDWSVLSLT
ncbi:melanosome organization [Desmophyllum pertusum]|uniref:Melanosome organization n=1 Tax=Desmophyllum pertusum TaxID=174260 RepID=A0A9W9ZPN3_9CNID|nr:melanosome organization [Desmophyllum pertusum]